MKRNWICTQCYLVFSRKWNLQRHYKLMHDINTRYSANNQGIIQSNFQRRELQSNDVAHGGHHEFNPYDDFKKAYEFGGELRNRFANSAQTVRRINYLEQELSNLHQQVRSYESQIFDFGSRNWLLSNDEIKGISGYVCKRCGTFSFRPILDPGYDMTMEAKHRCEYGTHQTSHIIFPIPLDIENVDEWAAQVLLDHLNLYLPIGKYLASFDISRAFGAFDKQWDSNVSSRIIGIPDRFYFYSLEKEYKIGWIDRALANLGKKILMLDTEILDFFRRAKSTYAIFEIPAGTTIRQISMRLIA